MEVEFEFVESGCEAAELLEVSEGSFDSVALSIKGTVEATLDFAQRTWRDHSGDAALLEMVQDGIGVVALVGEDGLGPPVTEQWDGLRAVVSLASGQQEAEWESEFIGE